MTRRALVILVLALATPAAAHGATLSVHYEQTLPADRSPDSAQGPAPAIDVYRVEVDGAGDDADHVAVAAARSVRDDGPGLVPGEFCAVDADGWGRCTPPSNGDHIIQTHLVVATGDGADQLTVQRGAVVDADLGAGDDDVVDDGSGRVAGRAGADRIVADAAGLPDGIATVTFDGGPGPDTAGGRRLAVSYAGRADGVRVTPDDVADDGGPGEGDDVAADVPSIIGGDGADAIWSSGGSVVGGGGDDRITGYDSNRYSTGEQLSGGPGNDTIDGRGGDDVLDGGAGDDALSGGPGADDLSDGPGRDHVDAGSGDDTGGSFDGSPDTWIGGPRHDSWRDRAAPARRATLTLDDRADDGRPGEHDDVRSDWESAEISSGHLVGTSGADHLYMVGRGRVDGLGGDDLISGGSDVRPGPGRDDVRMRDLADLHLDLRDGEHDTLSCTRDLRQLRFDRVDTIHGCFTVARPRLISEPDRVHGGARVSVRMTCRGYQDCRGRVSVVHGTPLAGTRFALRHGTSTTVHVRLPRRVPCGRTALVAHTASPFVKGRSAPHLEPGPVLCRADA